MFVALPLAVAVLLLSNIAQRKLSVRQIEAKINAGNRLEEYLQGIRVMKAYNLLGGKFERLKMALVISVVPVSGRRRFSVHLSYSRSH